MSQTHSSTLFLAFIVAFVDVGLWMVVIRHPKGRDRMFLSIAGVCILGVAVAFSLSYIFF